MLEKLITDNKENFKGYMYLQSVCGKINYV